MSQAVVFNLTFVYPIFQTLTRAAAVAQLVGAPAATYAPWLDAAARIFIVFDASRMYHPESANYSLGKMVKQADTILLGFPFEFQHDTFTPATRAADLEYYKNVTDPGSVAMTWALFAVGFIELGAAFAGEAATTFNRSFANAQLPFYVWTETPTGGAANFITGAGGYLQAALNGYTGLRINASGAFFSPSLGEDMTTLGIHGLSYLGNRLDVDFDGTNVRIALQTIATDAELAAAGESARTEYSAVRSADSWREVDPRLSLMPRDALATRAQRGRVLIDGRAVTPSTLELIDAAGTAHTLVAGSPVELALQPFRIVRAPPRTPTAPSPRRTLQWLVPYDGLTNSSAYEAIWAQLRGFHRPNRTYYAASAYALKANNASLGYATTPAGEALDGLQMELYGFPALRALGLGDSILGMVYVTHEAAIAKMLADPTPFIEQLRAKAVEQGLRGFDIDYEPQAALRAERVAGGATFMGFLGALGAALVADGRELTIDVGGCPSTDSFECAGVADAGALPGLAQVNTMDSFSADSAAAIEALAAVDAGPKALGSRWAPGFEPNNAGPAAFAAMMKALTGPSGARALATWAVNEWNTGPQPAWLFDALDTFLDAP